MRSNRRAVFSVVKAALFATQRCQHATIEEAMYSVGAVPRLYNEDLRQQELELTESLELAVHRLIDK
jgi:hypothetical protein